MTYERPEILLDTIKCALSQSFPPEKILIVDNSESYKTQELFNELNDSRLEYLRVGYNSGPAGAAALGLQRLTNEGYDWIYWGDDDNPIDFEDSFEDLFNIINSDDVNIGIIGGVGQAFNCFTGGIVRINTSLLEEKRYIKVDSIAGNQAMLVKSKVIMNGILPNKNLFFGFEEFDFCLRVKKAGFNLVVNSSLYLRSRKKYKRTNYERPFYILKDKNKLKREYYSVRNSLFILKSNKLFLAFIFQFLKNVAKSLYGFRFGINYGWVNFKFISLGIVHSLLNRLGKLE